MSKYRETIKNVNKHIGNKIYDLRLGLGMSRKELAKKINVSGQQLQKYETGANQMSAGRLILAAKVLGKDVNYFYKDFEIYDEKPRLTKSQRMCLEVSKNSSKIKNFQLLEKINCLVKEIVTTK